MLFNSLAFACFLPVVFALYWSLRSLHLRNAVIVLASYVFYGWWDWRFLGLIFLSSLLDYLVALGLGTAGASVRRKLLLGVSISAQLGLLATFKYYDFFALSLKTALAHAGIAVDPLTLDLVLPVGISFYTFQTMSYTIDVYRRRLPACRDPLAFFAYVSFFPQLVAGPIERATHLLPQFRVKHVFDPVAAADGMRQMLWGFFKKAVIADNCAPIVAKVFDHPDYYTASTLVWAVFLFAFQIYCDFSGYSDIAIGCARLFGFRLMRNFAFPYFSRDIGEFWRRWHISLTTWFRDYVYTPLGGSLGGRWRTARNVLIVFLLSGLWHGANTTFITWGAYNALLFLPLVYAVRGRRHVGEPAQGRMLPRWREAWGIVFTFACVLIGWVFFRAATLSDAFAYLRQMASPSLLSPSKLFDPWLLLLIVALLAGEWVNRTRQHALEVAHLPAWSRRALYLCVFAAIMVFGRFARTDFIYFQF